MVTTPPATTSERPPCQGSAGPTITGSRVSPSTSGRSSASRATVAEVLDGLTDAGLARPVSSATPFLTDATGLTVADCLRVVLNEEWEHRLYAERDLAVLASR